MAGKIYLKRGKDKPLRNRHPWIFSGAVAGVEDVEDGGIADVYDTGNNWLARVGFNSRSQIVGRVWTFEKGEEIGKEFFGRAIARANLYRNKIFQFQNPNSANLGFEIEMSGGGEGKSAQNALRLVNAESDFMPGVVVDRYGEFLVVQFLTLAADVYKEVIVQVLQEQFEPQGIYERSDVDVRRKEGLKETTGVLYGEEPPDRVLIIENELKFWVDVKRGHKTGFYLDQRENRQRAAPYLTGEVLNAFAYTGAFGVYAAQVSEAKVTNLDASAASLELARENFENNGYVPTTEFVVGDAFDKFREYRAAGRKFDGIVLDPPKFVTSAGNLEKAARGYKDLNMLALQLLNPNGFMMTFSCSGLVDAKLFQQIVFSAAVDARRDAQIVERLGQAPDHPIGVSFPEGEYLKGLIVRVV